MRRSLILLFVLAGVLAGHSGEAVSGPSALTPEAVKAGIDKGVEWLKTQQSPDGTFSVSPVGAGKGAPGTHEAKYLEGTTALGLLTLLKCGMKPDDPAIVKGFDWLMERPPTRVYTVAVTILALEARFAPKPDQVEKDAKKRPYETIAREKFAKISRPEDKKWLDDLTKWLLAQQETSVWRYPSHDGEGPNQDNSCTQYAVLALKSAVRLGAEVPPECFEKVAEYFIEQQDATGPEVTFFPVPAADGTIVYQRDKPAPGKTTEKAVTGHSMHARGWGYLPRPPVKTEEPAPTGKGSREKPQDKTSPVDPQVPAGGPPAGREFPTTGSMTCSGIAALVICKSELEREKAWWARFGPRVDQAIRDGCAWLEHHFSVTKNPPGRGWLYYYLYGLERAGVLAGTYELGKHDWYDEGALHLLELQQASGAWPSESSLSEFADSCFALLFLKRGTIPLLKLPPKRTITGGGNELPDRR